MALMDQIKSDMKGQKRIFDSDTEESSVATQIDDNADSFNRTALSSAVHRRKASRGEKDTPGPKVLGHRRTSSMKSSGSRTKGSPKKNHSRTIPSDEIEQALANNLARISISDRTANANTNNSIAAPPITDRAAPVPAQRPPPPSLAPPAYPSIRAGANEDLNRYVSSSTTASGSTGTTLTSGAPSFIKHAGPPHLRTIVPTDIPPVPERLGDMVFDKVMMRWIKNTELATRDPDESGGSLADLSDDPFGDIESLHDESRGSGEEEASPVPDELEPPAAEEEDIPRAGVAEMSAIEERSEAEDDGDDGELELTSFSTDASVHVVDIMTGVDTTGYNDGDETTDSEDDGDLLDNGTSTATVPVIDYESGDESFSPATAAAHVHQPQAPLVAVSAASPYLGLDAGLSTPSSRLRTPNRRSGSNSVAATPIRSALKSSGTPNSAMKSRSAARYETPQGKQQPQPHGTRSVSFSDGRRDGPIVQDLSSSVTDSEPSLNVGGSRGGRAFHEKSVISQPSVRTRRIADMMDALVNSGSFSGSMSCRGESLIYLGFP